MLREEAIFNDKQTWFFIVKSVSVVNIFSPSYVPCNLRTLNLDCVLSPPHEVIYNLCLHRTLAHPPFL